MCLPQVKPHPMDWPAAHTFAMGKGPNQTVWRSPGAARGNKARSGTGGGGGGGGGGGASGRPGPLHSEACC